jgi:hypothetical protein
LHFPTERNLFSFRSFPHYKPSEKDRFDIAELESDFALKFRPICPAPRQTLAALVTGLSIEPQRR